MMIKKIILSVISAATVICSANAIEAQVKSTDTPSIAVDKNCPNYVLIPGYIYEWRIDENGCRYPVLISRG
ncbi:hypothetical protein SG34_014405 [Thalassomonas viridans]|uniref:Uncharacterized protein n=1 Tax=Thalassomonas viridans TaxID=137584 RepID=A0AAE9Z823_9GAMM|nr:hypothetical protein [Thalassomonas viridans]WDE07972.1 hypothetical protein SG34_014405 [Thalassomonas viridans]